MPSVRLKNGVRLHYEDYGDPTHPAVILIMGLGAQMTVWPDPFYYGLAQKGLRVIRFDNRDVGLSSHFDQCGNPNLLKIWLTKPFNKGALAPYTLDEMACDVVGLMKALKIKKAHIIGASMGGMIGQIVAAKHKKKVLSLTSIMSSSYNIPLSKQGLKVLFTLAKHQPKNVCKDAFIDYTVKLNQLIGSPNFPQNEQALYQQAKQNVERSLNPNGIKRQLAAIAASQNRKHLLAAIKVPTLVIHGEHDPVIPVKAGYQTAQAIKRSKLKSINGMGHDFPPELMTKLTKWIYKHVQKAQKRHLKKQMAKQNSANHLPFS